MKLLMRIYHYVFLYCKEYFLRYITTHSKSGRGLDKHNKNTDADKIILPKQVQLIIKGCVYVSRLRIAIKMGK